MFDKVSTEKQEVNFEKSLGIMASKRIGTNCSGKLRSIVTSRKHLRAIGELITPTDYNRISSQEISCL